MNILFPNILKLRIVGPLNQLKQRDTLKHLHSMVMLRTQAIVVVINSQGGSIVSAKNISSCLQAMIHSKKIPVYCFAEQFCMNSANLILTAGTKCFANQFSILGDYGYSHDVYDFTTLCGMNIGYEQFSNTPIQQSSPFLGINHIASKDFARKMVEEQEKCLKEEIVKNRKAQIAHRQIDLKRLTDETMSQGLLLADQAQKTGLIDGIKSVDGFLREEFKSVRIQKDKQASSYAVTQIIRKIIATMQLT